MTTTLQAATERLTREQVILLAEEQERCASAGAYPFEIDWVQVRDVIPGAAPRSRYALRAAGIQNLANEVAQAVEDGVRTPQQITATLRARFGDTLQTDQIHRALYKLVRQGLVVRVGPAQYEPTKG